MDKDSHANNIIELMKHTTPRRERTPKQPPVSKTQVQGHGNITGDVQISNSTVMLGAEINSGLVQRIAELELAVQELRTNRKSTGT